MKLTKPHGLTSGNQTRQWRILPGFSQLVPPFRLASPGHVWLAKGNWLRGTKACSLDWSQVSGCLDRTWTVGPGRNLPWLGMVEIAPIKMGDDLGMALFCVLYIYYMYIYTFDILLSFFVISNYYCCHEYDRFPRAQVTKPWKKLRSQLASELKLAPLVPWNFGMQLWCSWGGKHGYHTDTIQRTLSKIY